MIHVNTPSLLYGCSNYILTVLALALHTEVHSLVTSNLHKMWSNLHSQPSFTPDPGSASWDYGSDQQNGEAPYLMPPYIDSSYVFAQPSNPTRTAFGGDNALLRQNGSPTTTLQPASSPLVRREHAPIRAQLTEVQPQCDRVRRRIKVPHNHRYTESEWQQQRSAIKSLYIDQDLSLKETMKLMSSRYAFNPPSVVHCSIFEMLLIFMTE